jgi:hypothetical protein
MSWNTNEMGFTGENEGKVNGNIAFFPDISFHTCREL